VKQPDAFSATAYFFRDIAGLASYFEKIKGHDSYVGWQLVEARREINSCLNTAPSLPSA
jgi:hypothetical protein